MDPLSRLLEAVRQAVREELKASLPDEYLTVRQAAKVSSLAVPTIRLYIREGKLKSRRAGRRVIISRKDLEKFLEVQNASL